MVEDPGVVILGVVVVVGGGVVNIPVILGVVVIPVIPGVAVPVAGGDAGEDGANLDGRLDPALPRPTIRFARESNCRDGPGEGVAGVAGVLAGVLEGDLAGVEGEVAFFVAPAPAPAPAPAAAAEFATAHARAASSMESIACLLYTSPSPRDS